MPDYPQIDPNPNTYNTWADPAWMVQYPLSLHPQERWDVSSATTGESTAPLLRAQYGDGYEQIARDGINQVGQSVRIDISPVPPELAMDIYAFLEAQGTYGKPFYWTPPRPMKQIQVLWTCEKWNWKRNGGTIVGVSAELKYFPRP